MTQTVEKQAEEPITRLVGTGTMRVLSQSAGDTRVTWSRRNAAEVAAARRSFDELTSAPNNFAAFSVSAGQRGERIKEFDPEAEEILIVPPVAGGAD